MTIGSPANACDPCRGTGKVPTKFSTKPLAERALVDCTNCGGTGHAHHFVPLKIGTHQGDPMFVLTCECGATR